MINKLHGLYVITDDKLTPIDTIYKSVELSLRGGAKIVQLRTKIYNDKTISYLSLKIQDMCREYGALFILNDRIDIAIKLGLDGIHIGKDDYMDLKTVRENFRGVIGVSCYNDLKIAKNAQKNGADYVAFGACFASSTKPNAPTLDLNIIKKAKEKLEIPICAIGGINRSNIKTLLEYKPDMVAIISDIWNSDDIKERSLFFNTLLN
jgi:thiamine-phosphate pyrophosphorylase